MISRVRPSVRVSAASRYGTPVISKYAAARKNRVAAGDENIGDGVGWGQCTQLKVGPRADAPTSSAKRGLAIACRLSVRL